LSKEFIVPELLQEASTPQALATATLNWLDKPQEVARLKERFNDMHQSLLMPTGALVAKVIAEVIND
jgi:lipid-A-disaccharide synthase